jgi:hypothetical protein
LFTNGAQNKFRFRNFEPVRQIFYLDAIAYTIAISTIRHRECLPRSHALQRVHCFNSYEVRAVTFAQRRENDSL